MIQQGNKKLGGRCWQWSLPARKTCPGASPTCLELCYALEGRYYLPSVKKALVNNYRITKSQEFVPWMIQTLRHNFVGVFRIHVSGDFYSEKYIRDWIQIVKRSPSITFFTYTRSYAVPDYRRAILELGRLPNLQMWWSFDRDMQTPAKVAGVRRCYLAADDEDQPPCHVDLVFRENNKTVMKYARYRSLICPPENGVTKTTCSQCGICWRNHVKTDDTTASRSSAKPAGSNSRAAAGALAARSVPEIKTRRHR